MGLPPIEIRSEIGPLKRVLLHRPGRELENLMPEYIERLLFDDIPYLKIAQEEHDAFCHLLRQNGVEVVYLTDLVAESLADPAVKDQFLQLVVGCHQDRSARRLIHTAGFHSDYTVFNDVNDTDAVLSAEFI